MGGPNVITKVPKSGGGRQKRVGDRDGPWKRHQKDAVLLASKLEGEDHELGHVGIFKRWKRQDTHSALESLERNATLLTSRFESMRPVCLT